MVDLKPVLGLLLVGALLIPTLLGLVLVFTLAMPRTTSRMSGVLKDRSFMCFLIGLLISVVMVALIRATEVRAHQVSGILGAIWIVLLLIGLPGISEDMGRRLFALGERTPHRALQITVGWLALGSASLFPFVGWLVVLPYAACAGLGAFVLAIFSRPFRTEPDRSGS